MKVAIMCDSVLLKKSLEIFLDDYIAPYEQCDVVISDRKLSTDKPLCFIGTGEEADIKKPFSRAQLILGLERFVKRTGNRVSASQMDLQQEPVMNLRDKVTLLTNNYVNELVHLIEAHYGKR